MAGRVQPPVAQFSLLLVIASHAASLGLGALSAYGNATRGYDEGRAKLFMFLSAAAYCDADQINSWGCKPCKLAGLSLQARTFINGSTQCFVGYADSLDQVIVSFRGSHSIQDWITNLNFPQTAAYPSCDGCKVHEGFFDSWLSVEEEAVAEVQRLLKLHPKAEVFVTGHSLGAALAALCAAELGASTHSMQDNIGGVYTYGQPRVGNKQFAHFYNTGKHVSWRVTHWHDPVPHLPLEWQGFWHTATEVFYNENR